MPRFASLQTRLNGAVAAHLADASAVWQGGEPFDVLFERNGIAALGEVEGYQPMASFDTANTPGLAQEDTLAIDGTAYVVVSDVEPDEAGWVTVRLRKAA